MIYTVECSFTNADEEASWNEFYSLIKLPALISVAGFMTSQRFETMTKSHPRYLAIHTLVAGEVLDSSVYQAKGGGNFSRWQPWISEWRRNLYSGIARAPAVTKGQSLVVRNADVEGAPEIGAILLRAAGLQGLPRERHMWVVDRQLPWDAIPGAAVYLPMGDQLQSTS